MGREAPDLGVRLIALPPRYAAQLDGVLAVDGRTITLTEGQSVIAVGEDFAGIDESTSDADVMEAFAGHLEAATFGGGHAPQDPSEMSATDALMGQWIDTLRLAARDAKASDHES